ncbi:hypothetical protein KPL37_19070 [Clostridium frigoris]|uniref:Uncharacterized protein n=1 Tax=Clostridium frigoris TaxID=205327 RepID=A0ABS6BYT4_9CLOT|nr:hypothetical protein [Clostridium frigoris]MBU3161790.1 hypothetical protein [Clostridium frigoris]
MDRDFRNFSATCVCFGYTLQEIEKDINEMRIEHEKLNENAEVIIKVEPELKDVKFDGHSKK